MGAMIESAKTTLGKLNRIPKIKSETYTFSI